MRNLLLLFSLVGLSSVSLVASADLEINKVVDAEIQKCQPLMDMRSIVAFSLAADWGNFSESRLKSQLSPDQVKFFMSTLANVKPYLTNLAETGEVIHDVTKSQLSSECAAFAKGAMMIGELKINLATGSSSLTETQK